MKNRIARAESIRTDITDPLCKSDKKPTCELANETMIMFKMSDAKTSKNDKIMLADRLEASRLFAK